MLLTSSHIHQQYMLDAVARRAQFARAHRTKSASSLRPSKSRIALEMDSDDSGGPVPTLYEHAMTIGGPVDVPVLNVPHFERKVEEFVDFGDAERVLKGVVDTTLFNAGDFW